MYSPFDDLQKMWLTPHYILFKVDINGKQYYGRVSSLISKPFNGKFEGFDNLFAAQSGSPGIEIRVSPEEITGLEAYDSFSNQDPSPFSKILLACIKFDKISTIDENATLIVQNIINAIEDFTKEHQEAKNNTANTIANIKELLAEYSNETNSKENAEVMKDRLSLIIEYMFRSLA
jgi:hypothetical protein